MRLIYSKHIPFKGYKAINLFGFVFVREGCVMSDKDINHEAIHTAQMREMLYIGFYVAYITEWLVRLLLPGNAYRNISFEREAYAHERDMDYLDNRTSYAWSSYVFT